jgi:hypothetical protein
LVYLVEEFVGGPGQGERFGVVVPDIHLVPRKMMFFDCRSRGGVSVRRSWSRRLELALHSKDGAVGRANAALLGGIDKHEPY